MEFFKGGVVGNVQFEEKEFAAAVASISLASEELLNSMAFAFRYQGYDPQVTYIQLKAKANTLGVSQEQFYADIRALLMWFVVRGSRLTGKAETRTSENVLEVMSKLKVRYEIKDSGGGKSPNYKLTDITLPRIAGVFPHVVGDFLNRGYGRILGAKPNDLLRAYAWAGGAALIKEDDRPTFDKWLSWSKNFDAIIKGDKPATEEGKLKQFGETIWRSVSVNAATRLRLSAGWKNFGN